CDVRRTRRSGPGGQHRNKVESAVVITHRPTGVVAEASERRSQHENHSRAVFRLRVKLALAVRSDSADSSPSVRWLARCRDGRLAINPEHDDFPALLAEALDQLHHSADDIARAAELLKISKSQFVKLLGLEPSALVQVNARRIAKGLKRLS
ncbi:MAG TPA: peptide chain release factor-like protein, partial [Pirellulaceae bacterium]|nr:peptide chain release factor-like protein [Pirellulaceae bacterium]